MWLFKKVLWRYLTSLHVHIILKPSFEMLGGNGKPEQLHPLLPGNHMISLHSSEQGRLGAVRAHG